MGRPLRLVPPTYAPPLVFSHGNKFRDQTFCTICDGRYYVRSVPEMHQMSCVASCYVEVYDVFASISASGKKRINCSIPEAVRKTEFYVESCGEIFQVLQVKKVLAKVEEAKDAVNEEMDNWKELFRQSS
ncbi:hypothetical protein IFM89_029649 [Coptis chinensis]|uniref:Uncharacterized protein n=1 Tax=Coptis chinensis TaxID=261450 RepID=A0A835IEA5_9MAGN|nr:hypothetical protein IFM89_029649 [Coptis chinensis]